MAKAILLGAGWLASGVAGVGCGTNARGVSACRTIEQARCRRAAVVCPALSVSDEPGLETCIEAARDRCLHGMAVSSEPSSAVVDICAQAIGQASCDAVRLPATLAECAALLTPTTDQGAAGASGQGAADAALDDASTPSSADSGS